MRSRCLPSVDVERVLHRARRMVLRLLSAVKLYQSVSISGPSATSKPSEWKSASMRSSVRVTGCSAADALSAPGQRDVERLGLQLRFELCSASASRRAAQRRLDLVLRGVEAHAHARALLRRQLAERLQQLGDAPALPR